MAKNTRLATTVTARYFPGEGAADAFYLDGRMNGAREQNFADITLDREDRGSFFAVYASTHGAGTPSDGSDGNRDLLAKISQDLKQNSRQKIDQEINELAECAVSVTGRLMLADKSEVQPYFAGVVIKDGEIAAVTMGRGCAYLYRDDALFPLTQDDLSFEPVDYYGKSLPNMGDFSAGVAGTIRYSNIAQIKANDCLILCNREVMEIIGQRRMLQLLDQAEDQCDAAGMVMGLATHENSDAALQFMIGFVEDLIPLDRLGRSTLARGFAKLSRETGMQTGTQPIPRNTGRVAMPAAAAAVAGSQAAHQQNERTWVQPASETGAQTGAVGVERGQSYNADGAVPPATDVNRVSAPPVTGAEGTPVSAANVPVADLFQKLEQEEKSSVFKVRSESEFQAPLRQERDVTGGTAPYSPDAQTTGTARFSFSQPIAGAERASEQAASAAKVHEEQPSASTGHKSGTEETTSAVQTAFNEAQMGGKPSDRFKWASHQKPLEKEDFDLPPEEDKRRNARHMPLEAVNETSSDKAKKIALIVLILIAALLVGFIVYSLLSHGSGTAAGSSTTSSSLKSVLPQESSTKPSGANQPSVPTTAPSNIANTSEVNPSASGSGAQTPGIIPDTYTIKAGDTVYQVVARVYNLTNDTDIYNMVEKVAAANPDLDLDSVPVGQQIKLPKP